MGGECNRLITAGFSKDARYQLALWDMRKIAEGEEWESLKLTNHEPNPALLTPTFDAATGLLYLTGRVRLYFNASRHLSDVAVGRQHPGFRGR